MLDTEMTVMVQAQQEQITPTTKMNVAAILLAIRAQVACANPNTELIEELIVI
jgi:hypothetical protein